MNKLLIICGPTATGKTTLALSLAKKFKGELVSADSRQVYKHMNIVTGKDLPVGVSWHPAEFPIYNFQFPIGYWSTTNGIRIFGYDIVRPDQDFSVKLYRDFANTIIADIIARGKLPILVGGTGLFIGSIINPMNKINIPRNDKLRDKYANCDAVELLQIYIKKNPQKAIALNSSERKNSSRLLRRIEIDEYEKRENTDYSNRLNENRIVFDNILQLGLEVVDRGTLNSIIDARVDARIGKRMDREIEYLIKKDFINYAPKRTIGYSQWMEHLSGAITRDKAIEKWKIAEHQYAKRQGTWFKKQKDINWFDVTRNNWKSSVESVAQKWHNETE